MAISAAQLLAGVAGHLIAVRQHRAFDVAVIGWRGRPDRVARDSWLIGTGLSAPVVMLAAQVVATARLALGPSPAASGTLAGLGVVMSCGYLVEQEFRNAVSPAGWDRRVTPVATTGFVLAVATAVVACRSGLD